MFSLDDIRNRLRKGALVLTRQPVRKFEDWSDGESWAKILGWSDAQVGEWTKQFVFFWLQQRAAAGDDMLATRLAAGDLKGAEDLIDAAIHEAAKVLLPKIQAAAQKTALGAGKITAQQFNRKPPPAALPAPARPDPPPQPAQAAPVPVPRNEPAMPAEGAPRGGQPAGAEVRLVFDRLNPKALEFINGYSLHLIKGLTDQQRDGIRDVIRNAFQNGGNPREQAKQIRQHIGLLPRQQQALDKYKNGLWQKHGGFKAIMALPPAKSLAIRQKVYAQADAYSDRLLKQRALVIARTETIRVSAMGQLEAWKESARQGLIDPANTVRFWITTKDDKTCEFCRGLHGKEVAFDAGEWTSTVKRSDGTDVGYTALTPPLHPCCRCAMGLRIGTAPLRVTVEAQGKPGSGARKPKAAPVDPWADKVKKLIDKGIGSEADLIKVGKLVVDEIDRLEAAAAGAKLKPLENEAEQLWQAVEAAGKQYKACFENGWRRPEVPREEVDRLEQAYTKVRIRRDAQTKTLEAARKALTNQGEPDRDIRRQVLERIRPMGPPPGQEYHPATVTPQADPAVQEWLKNAMQYMPRAWVEKSYQRGPMILQTDPARGFHKNGGGSNPSVLCVDTPRRDRTAFHEMMHRTESVFGPGLQGYEWQFYERRTKGSALKTIPGYADWEVARKDKFQHVYMGKDYRPVRGLTNEQGMLTTWEILSMGAEYEFYGPNAWDGNVLMRNDPNHRHFVYGVFASL